MTKELKPYGVLLEEIRLKFGWQPGTKPSSELLYAEAMAWFDSAEGVEEERKRQEKENRKKERERVRQAARDAEREERRRNPKSPIDAYYNWMETCPYPSGSKERKEWKRDNPMVFNGVTYVDHWSFQRSNSGKTSRPAGYLSGSDGSTHELMNDHINNRRSDPNRNWGLPE